MDRMDSVSLTAIAAFTEPFYQLRDVSCGDTMVLVATGTSTWALSGDFDVGPDSRYLAIETAGSTEFFDRELGVAYHLNNLDEAMIAACLKCVSPNSPCRRPGGVKWRIAQVAAPIAAA